MDVATLAVLVFIAVVGLIMLGKLLGHLIGAIAIIAAIVKDLADIGVIVIFPDLGWIADLVVFFLILLSFRNIGAFLSLPDLVPIIGFLPFHTLSLLISWAKQRREKEEKERAIYIAKK